MSCRSGQRRRAKQVRVVVDVGCVCAANLACIALVRVSLSQPERRGKGGEKYPTIGFYVLEIEDKEEAKLGHPVSKMEGRVAEPVFRNTRDSVQEISVKVGVSYRIIPCTFEAGVESKFWLKTVSVTGVPVGLRPATAWPCSYVRGVWRASDGVVGYRTWPRNPQFRLSVREPGKFKLVLREVKAEGRGDDVYSALYVCDSSRSADGRVGEQQPWPKVTFQTVFTTGVRVIDCSLQAGDYTLTAVTHAALTESTSFLIEVLALGTEPPLLRELKAGVPVPADNATLWPRARASAKCAEGEALLDADNAHGALAAFREALDLEASPEAFGGLADVLLSVGEFEDSLFHAEDALAMDPGFPKVCTPARVGFLCLLRLF
jgi:Calpain large subunit, domain III